MKYQVFSTDKYITFQFQTANINFDELLKVIEEFLPRNRYLLLEYLLSDTYKGLITREIFEKIKNMTFETLSLWIVKGIKDILKRVQINEDDKKLIINIKNDEDKLFAKLLEVQIYLLKYYDI